MLVVVKIKNDLFVQTMCFICSCKPTYAICRLQLLNVKATCKLQATIRAPTSTCEWCQRHKSPFSRQLCVLSHPLLDDFCTTTRHFMSNSTAQNVFFLTKLHNESSSCCQSCTTTRYFTSNSTTQDVFFKTTLHIKSSSC